MLQKEELKAFLDEKYDQYNRKQFIETDPIQIPHLFHSKEDIEIAGFLTAILAWGGRKMIIQKARELINLMDQSPFDFISNAKESDFNKLKVFQYRTFMSVDAIYFMKALQHIYLHFNGLEGIYADNQSVEQGHQKLFNVFFSNEHEKRTEKHLANVSKGSAAKRLNMFLRWMVRNDNRGVDFGIWNTLKPSDLYLPLDTHTAKVSRSLGLLNRNQNDWQAVVELTNNLKEFDSEDPVKYDFALFGLGVFEKF